MIGNIVFCDKYSSVVAEVHTPDNNKVMSEMNLAIRTIWRFINILKKWRPRRESNPRHHP